MPVDDAVAAAVNAEQRTALDPSTDPQVLAAIVEHRPDLRPAVAMNPTAYPALLEWLGNLNDPVINAALATREPSTEGAPPVSAPVPTVATAPPITAPDAAVPAPRPNRPVPAKRHPGLLIGAAAAIIVLAGGGYLATQLLNNPQPTTTSVAPGQTASPSPVASAATVETPTPAEAKAAAIKTILASSDRMIDGSPTYPVVILSREGELAFAVVLDGEARLGTASAPLAPVDGEVTGNRVTAVDGWDALSIPQIQERQADVLALHVSLSDNPAEGFLRTDNGTLAYVATSTLTYDTDADTVTDEQGTVFRVICEYQICGYQAEDGTELGPAWSERDSSPGQAPRPGTYPIRVLASDGSQTNDELAHRNRVSISADGRYVAFASAASNLVPGDTNGVDDVFLFDRNTGTTTRVSVATDGTQANDYSAYPVVSADGHWIAFTSQASTLIPGDTTEGGVFLWNRDTGTTTRVSASGIWADISANGRYTVYLKLGGNNGIDDVFLFDRDTGTTTRVSDSTEDHLEAPVISADGRYVAYSAHLWDRETGTTTTVPAYGSNLDISADGRYIVYDSFSSELVPGDTNGDHDVFLFDRDTGTTTRVSVATDGTQAVASDLAGSRWPAISADGRWITYASIASNLVPGDVNRAGDIFLWDRDTGTTTRVSVAADGTQTIASFGSPAVSADGQWIAYPSDASDLVPGDTNGHTDVFLTRNLHLR